MQVKWKNEKCLYYEAQKFSTGAIALIFFTVLYTCVTTIILVVVPTIDQYREACDYHEYFDGIDSVNRK